MDEEFEKIEVEYAPLCDQEIDVHYEFDAPQYHNFDRRETLWDDAEAEQWFEFADSYPPSPFLLKLRWGKSGAMEGVNICTAPEQDSAMEDNDSRGLEYFDEIKQQDMLNGKKKSLSKSSQSSCKDCSFMRPTASHLAKQKNLTEVQNPQSFRRSQRQNSSSSDVELTKRQKIGAGYLRKIARLKHHILFTHKKTKEVDGSDLTSIPNVTIPKEPNLVTAQRAQRHRPSESSEPTQSSSQVLKARPIHKKILEAPSQLFPKMKTPRPTKFQEFNLRTSQRAMQHTSNVRGGMSCNFFSNCETKDLKRTNSSVGSRHDKCRSINKLQGSSTNDKSGAEGRGVFRSVKVFPLEPNDNGPPDEPPTESFKKLSMASQDKQTTKSPSKEQQISKGLKENRSGSLRLPSFHF